jgi:FKBP-type peptidyl-prolyl cis-trans isomerase FkpA
MKKLLVLTIVSVFAISCMDKGPGSVKLKSEEDKTFYAMGFMLGSNLQKLELNDQELGALYKGLNDAAKGNKEAVEMQIYQPKISQMFKERMDKVAANEEKKGSKFIEDFIKNNKDAKKTESGLVYQVIKEGKMLSQQLLIRLKFTITVLLTNGTVFDSSVDRGKTITFPLNRVIKGWTEGLQLLGEGGKIKLVIPPAARLW